MEKETAVLKKHMIDLANQSYQNNMFTFTSFLSLYERQLLQDVKKEIGSIPFSLYGGNEDCERVMVRFGDPQELGYEEEFPICCVCVSPVLEKFADALSHRDFLGAVMNLGIERNTIGDIFVEGKCAYIYCHTKISEYLLEELDKVKHTHVKTRIVTDVTQLPIAKPVSKVILVSSKRADAVIAKVCHLSRTQSLELFFAGRVFVNGKLTENNSAILKAGDQITVRGFGKFIFAEELQITKKEKLRIRIEQYE